MQDRLATRDEIGNRPDRGDIREDWHDRYDNFYDRHQDWHHGYWHGNAGNWWHHMWDDHTALMVFGTTMWGINAMAYAFGYWGYSNPYYTESYPVDGGAMIDYSQPIELPAEAAAPAGDTPAPGMTDFDAARQAFYQGDYAAALGATNKALAAMPSDPIIHEFRALVMFAQGKYKEAAAGLYSVLSVGPGWDWTTLSSLYPSVDVYTKQLRALESYVGQHPTESDARFVLAYHYLTVGNKDVAAGQLQELHKQMPQDKLITELLLMAGGPDAIGATPPAPMPVTPGPDVKAADLVGKWEATGQSSTRYAMELKEDGNFTWTFTQNGKSETVQGVYALDGDVLALEPTSGGVMLGQITAPQGGRFDFKLMGAPPGDQGLKFAKGR